MVKYAVLSQRQAGFTLVELVTTIILISILAVVVLPRLFSTSSYSAYSLRNEFMAELRQVQQKAMNNTDMCYRLSVTPNAYQLQRFSRGIGINCTGTGTLLYQQTLPGGAVLAFNNNNTFDIDFANNGRLSLACNGNCIRVQADDTVLINVSGEGYIYAN